MANQETKLRVDARTNRDRILDVARAALAVNPQVPLSAIVKAAGVGQGTLYRHFPSREALVLGVYRSEIDAIVALAPKLLAGHPALQAFQTWCDRLADFAGVKHGVADMLHAAISEQEVHETFGLMVGAVRLMIDACEAASDIRPDADPEDVLMLLSVLWQIPPTLDGKARRERLIAHVFRGLQVEELKM